MVNFKFLLKEHNVGHDTHLSPEQRNLKRTIFILNKMWSCSHWILSWQKESNTLKLKTVKVFCCITEISKMLEKCLKTRVCGVLVLSSGLQIFYLKNSECPMFMTSPPYPENPSIKLKVGCRRDSKWWLSDVYLLILS